MIKRSPRYPRQNLSISLEQAKKLFRGVHRAKVDVDTAAKLIGYASSSGGAASSAIGALRQFGLVDGLRGDVAISDLAMRILQPMDDRERYASLDEAARKPEIFSRIIGQFGGRLPPADEPIRAFLIRQEDFSAGGADDLIRSLRDTMSYVESLDSPDTPELHDQDVAVSTHSAEAASTDQPMRVDSPAHSEPALGSELISFPLGQSAKAELRLFGDLTSVSYTRLIRHLELLRDIAIEEEAAKGSE